MNKTCTTVSALALFCGAAAADDLRIGMIGLDTSHVTAFAKLLNKPDDPDRVPGARVVAGFRGGSLDVESSHTRVDKFTHDLETEYGVKIVESIPELCSMVDAVMLESVDGRPHLAQVRPIFEAKKPVFIDKPVAGSLRDAVEIYRLAREHGVPCFSSSSYRFYDSMAELKKQDVGEVRGAVSYGPCHLEPHHPDLFWYGVHSTEALFTALGTGCERVARVSTADTDVVSGQWSGGRTGVLVGLRTESTPHKVTVFGSKTVAEQASGNDSYRNLLFEIVKFFQTGVAPVSAEETLEIFAFMEAADESKRRDGAPVTIKEVMEEASAPAEP